MGFEPLLGNRRLKDNLSAALEKGRISHFYLISGPEGSGRHTLARLLAAAILCRGERGKPCLSCTPCRKVMENCHPDLITVEDPERKTLPVKLVRQYREDMFIRPNESDYKIYLFPQELGLEGQNALLKILEEPPSYGVFLLLTDNPEKLLPTVRSRCTELALTALPENLMRQALAERFPEASSTAVEGAVSRSGGFLGQALQLLAEGAQTSAETERFVGAFLNRDGLGLTQLLAPMEKWKRDQLIPELEQWQLLLEGGLACRAGMAAANPLAKQLGSGRSPRELMAALEAVAKALDYARSNVSPGAICGWLTWQLR